MMQKLNSEQVISRQSSEDLVPPIVVSDTDAQAHHVTIENPGEKPKRHLIGMISRVFSRRNNDANSAAENKGLLSHDPIRGSFGSDASHDLLGLAGNRFQNNAYHYHGSDDGSHVLSSIADNESSVLSEQVANALTANEAEEIPLDTIPIPSENTFLDTFTTFFGIFPATNSADTTTQPTHNYINGVHEEKQHQHLMQEALDSDDDEEEEDFQRMANSPNPKDDHYDDIDHYKEALDVSDDDHSTEANHHERTAASLAHHEKIQGSFISWLTGVGDLPAYDPHPSSQAVTKRVHMININDLPDKDSDALKTSHHHQMGSNHSQKNNGQDSDDEEEDDDVEHNRQLHIHDTNNALLQGSHHSLVVEDAHADDKSVHSMNSNSSQLSSNAFSITGYLPQDVIADPQKRVAFMVSQTSDKELSSKSNNKANRSHRSTQRRRILTEAELTRAQKVFYFACLQRHLAQVDPQYLHEREKKIQQKLLDRQKKMKERLQRKWNILPSRMTSSHQASSHQDEYLTFDDFPLTLNFERFQQALSLLGYVEKGEMVRRAFAGNGASVTSASSSRDSLNYSRFTTRLNAANKKSVYIREEIGEEEFIDALVMLKEQAGMGGGNQTSTLPEVEGIDDDDDDQHRPGEVDLFVRIEEQFDALYAGTCELDNQRDDEGSKFILAADLRRILSQRGLHMSDEEIEEMIREVKPRPPDGRIFLEQYQALLLSQCT